MKKTFTGICAVALLFVLSGCGKTESGDASAAIIYGAAALLSVALLIGCCFIDRKRDKWFLLLFSSVTVVNIGYFALSVSHTLEGALTANRISYLGSVFLPLSMLMIILNAANLRYKKRLPIVLLSLAAVVFLITASPGYLDIYYKEVSLVSVGGASALQKVYGPLHFVYAVYLACYFLTMVVAIIHACAAHKIESVGHSVILAIAVLANLGVWLVEQLADFNFEFLSISYIISELFLLGLHLMVAEQQRLKNLVAARERELTQTERALSEAVAVSAPAQVEADPFAVKLFADGMLELTKTEKAIFDAYVARMSTKEVTEMLNIKENTLKFHNKNLYQKLGVSSRKELLEIYRQMQAK